MAFKWINGKMVQLTEAELAAMQTTEPIIWHKEKPFRVLVSNETWKDWFAKKRDHADYLELTWQQLYPNLIALLDVVRMIANENIVKDELNTYVYLDEVFDYHLPIIKEYGATVESKPL